VSLLWSEPPSGSLFADEQFLPEVDPAYAGPRVYAPRRAQQTVLYRLVQDNLETWLATRREACLDDDPISPTVEKAFRSYLRCGIWAAGLVKFACPHHRDEAVFVALSCKTRGLCPSCGAKYMAKTALHLEQSVLPRVPFRQWVISFPKRVRYFLQRDPRRFRAVLRISMRAIERTIARHCPQAPRGARVAAVLFCQNFGASLNVHHHGHFVVSDGVYALDDEGNLTFTDRELVLDEAAIDKLTETIRTRVLRHLVRHGCLETDDADNMLSWEHHGGFSLDASVSMADWDRAGLQRVCRYCARHPFAKGRLQRAGPARVVYLLPKPAIDGTTQLVLDPLELLDRLADLVIPPRHHRHTYWGALAPHSTLRPFVVLEAAHDDGPRAIGELDPEQQPHNGSEVASQVRLPPGNGADSPHRSLCTPSTTDAAAAAAAAQLTGDTPGGGLFASLWALMLAKVYEVAPIRCPRCAAEMKPVAVIVDPESLDRICRNQGQPSAIPKLAPARGPPQADFDFFDFD
jgi:hypothetical protein